jgi:hypothetical protein
MSRWLKGRGTSDAKSDDAGYTFGDFTKGLLKKGAETANTVKKSLADEAEGAPNEYKFGDISKAFIQKGTKAVSEYQFGDVTRHVVKAGERATMSAMDYVSGVSQISIHLFAKLIVFRTIQYCHMFKQEIFQSYLI